MTPYAPYSPPAPSLAPCCGECASGSDCAGPRASVGAPGKLLTRNMVLKADRRVERLRADVLAAPKPAQEPPYWWWLLAEVGAFGEMPNKLYLDWVGFRDAALDSGPATLQALLPEYEALAARHDLAVDRALGMGIATASSHLPKPIALLTPSGAAAVPGAAGVQAQDPPSLAWLAAGAVAVVAAGLLLIRGRRIR